MVSPRSMSIRTALAVIGLLVGGLACRTSAKDDPADLQDSGLSADGSGDGNSGDGDSGDGDSGDGDSGDGNSGEGNSGDGDSGDGDSGDGDSGDGDSGEELCNGIDDDGDGEIDEDACPDVVVTDPSSGRAYLVVGTPMMWFEAASYCRSYGYQLATIDDEAENLYAWELIFDGEDGVSTSNAHTWIGLHQDVGGTWEWATGDAVVYTAWSGLEITDDYGTATYGQAAAIGDDASALWFEAPQTWFHHALCESP